MEIGFETKELRDVCHQEEVAVAQFGAAVAKALQKRIADIRAADVITEVIAGRPRHEHHENMDCFRFDLAENYVLTVIAGHLKPRLNAAKQTDWQRVRRIKVISLEKHEQTK